MVLTLLIDCFRDTVFSALSRASWNREVNGINRNTKILIIRIGKIILTSFFSSFFAIFFCENKIVQFPI